jgi:hypothetical protein
MILKERRILIYCYSICSIGDSAAYDSVTIKRRCLPEILWIKEEYEELITLYLV